jgi:hypothetical protein
VFTCFNIPPERVKEYIKHLTHLMKGLMNVLEWFD